MSDNKRKRKSRRVVLFPHGLIGFPGLNRFRVVEGGDENPFALLMSKDRKTVRFPMIDPMLIRPDYEIALSPEEIEELEIESRADVDVYSIVVVPPNSGDATINLRAPLLISRTNNVGVQILLSNDTLPIAASLAEELKREEAEMLL